ncbi:MAG: calcium/proton exchanger [Alicyclobacillaceae bacterium]|uniref:calcium/proton exchanger n=1 Tax=Alicyclobacillus sp. SP_1 TaxID=2942475 RepID=UPI002157704F|nr:calcium/proton exchanger [Alicyclobacillus sp. SP_1]MCY0888846.1 calcium/proton exchanger [Alicyclobacillaceae bacterium]
MRRLLGFVVILCIVPSVGAKIFHFSASIQFLFDCIAIVPLAAVMGRATEAVANHVGPRIGGLLSATFGNAVELLIGLFALMDGLTTLVKASITGSILGNLLFVLGLSFFVGGVRHPVQRFNLKTARSNAAMLMLGIPIAFVLPVIFSKNSPVEAMRMSSAVASVSLCVYLLGLFFSLFTHREVLLSADVATTSSDSSQHHWKLTPALLLLVVVTVVVGLESEWLVASVKPMAASLGWTQLFVGVIVVAIIGNAAEHASAVWMAWKNRMDLSLEIAVGSSMQVSMFIAPILFFSSLLFGHPMYLLFSWPELASLTGAILLVVLLVVDGESNWLEGAMAVGAYIVMAVGFFTLGRA